MIGDQQRKELEQKNEGFIKNTYAPLLQEGALNILINMRRDIDYILSRSSTLQNVPDWFSASFANVVAQFLNLCNTSSANSNAGKTIFSVHTALTYNTSSPNNANGQ